MVISSVQIPPPLLLCQTGAKFPQPPENARISISFGVFGLMAMLGSLLLVWLVFFRFLSVLLMTTSRMNSFDAGSSASSPPGAKSSGIALRSTRENRAESRAHRSFALPPAS